MFRDDVNFAIVNLLVREQLDMLMNTDLCDRYSFLEVYESIMFTFLRGISTEKELPSWKFLFVTTVGSMFRRSRMRNNKNN